MLLRPALLALLRPTLLAFLIALAHGVEEFDYSATGSKGPAHWGDLRPEWAICKTGQRQSPINIASPELHPVCALRLLQARYNATTAVISNLDHDIGLEFPENAGLLVIDRMEYKLQEYHIHAPSEHTVNGKRYAAEGHLVHKTLDGRIAVVSVLYNVGDEDDVFIDQVEHLLPSLRGTEHVNLVDASKLNVNGKRFFRYEGSLTTPPCTEGVIWNVLRRPHTMSHKQYDLLLKTLEGPNTRPLQSGNGRSVEYYK